MSRWFATPATTPRFLYPNEIFVRFVARHYYSAPFRSDINFLELGPGSGADIKFLEEQHFDVDGVDSALEAYANFHETIENFFIKYKYDLIKAYDCIYSLNVLCHVENPPYHEIAEALKPRGKFFAILPADNTEADLEGKGFTRFETPASIHSALDNIFSKIDIRPSCYPHRQRNHVNWVVEADK